MATALSPDSPPTSPTLAADAEVLSLQQSGRRVLLTGVPLEQALQPGWCNDNNHHDLDWTYGRLISPQEYNSISLASARSAWMHLQPSSGIVFELSLADVRLLQLCSHSGVQTGRRPESEAEELKELELRLPPLDDRQYFIRLDQCSPKDSVWRAGPITQRSQVVDCLVPVAR
jgi:hypothetical protein